MRKNAFFTGQPILSQLLSLIPRHIVESVSRAHQTNRYVKKFTAYNHLVTMLYCSFTKCSSLRELTTGMQACMHRLQHLGIDYSPRRSTVADANIRRSSVFFSDLYHKLVKHFYGSLPDSLNHKSVQDQLFIIDSSTISLFVDSMKGAGAYSQEGRKKGGAKAHVFIKASEDVPRIVRITEAKQNDQVFMHQLTMPRHSIITFDKAYVNSKKLFEWDTNQITWVTRIRKHSRFRCIKSFNIDAQSRQCGILNDQMIVLGRSSNKSTKVQVVRMVTFYDIEKHRIFVFITNNFTLAPQTIAEIYKKRWQIELLFKRLKSNTPLKYFLGNTPNAIKIQIWCALIADLLIKVVKDRTKKFKKRWSFTNLSGIIRHHLFTYMDLMAFLKDPDRALLKRKEYGKNLWQQTLF